MKKLLLILLFVGLWNLGFSEDSQKMLRLNRDFPLDHIDVLKNIQHDTLIFEGTDAFSMAKWEWGNFYPHRYNAPYVQDYYYEISVRGNGLVMVMDASHYGDLRKIGPYVSNPLPFSWILVGIWLAIHCFVFWVLRKLLLWIHRDYRYVTKQLQRRETIVSIIVTIVLTICMGWFVHSYFFLFLPAVYIILFFLPARTWYTGIIKRKWKD